MLERINVPVREIAGATTRVDRKSDVLRHRSPRRVHESVNPFGSTGTLTPTRLERIYRDPGEVIEERIVRTRVHANF